MKRFPQAVCLIGCIGVAISAFGVEAQQATVPTTAFLDTSRITIDQALTHLSGVEDRLRRQLNLTRRAIDAEVDAGRLDKAAARKLTDRLEITSVKQMAEILAEAVSVQDNAGLAQAYRALDTEWTAIQMERVAVIRHALFNAQTEAAAVGNTAQKPEDVDALLTSVEKLKLALFGLTPAFSRQLGNRNFAAIANYLGSLRRVLEELPQDEATSLGYAFFQWKNSANGLGSEEADGVARARIASIYMVRAKDVETAKAEMDAALQARKPAAALTERLGRLEIAVNRFERPKGGYKIIGLADEGSTLATYQHLVSAALALDSARFAQARSQISSARSAIGRDLGVMRVVQYTALLDLWDGEAAAGEDRQARQAREKMIGDLESLRPKFAAIRTPDDLEALIRSMEIESPVAEGRSKSGSPGSLRSFLGSLAATWRGDRLEMLRPNLTEVPPVLMQETIGLVSRVQRDLLAEFCQAPEINKPPLAALPTDQALQGFADQLASQGLWHRLLQFSEARNTADRNLSGFLADPDLAASIRSYIAAQNFELAEQWAQAVWSYKAAVRSTSPRAPVKECAVRLKELGKRHPEAVAQLQIPPTGGQ